MITLLLILILIAIVSPDLLVYILAGLIYLIIAGAVLAGVLALLGILALILA